MLNGQIIREFRHQLGMNQIDFSNEIGISQQALSQAERGEMKVSERLRKRIVYRFHITEDEIQEIRRQLSERNPRTA
ncbi:hypothetical protein C6W27_08980 [Bacillus paralicheniformis]|uniref:helix-turn-helix domain-containing protein n=1 Tax=Bacillus paralicheniformis TaxID=1648923 RepID=UPI000D0227B6|nr:helix-turn-helix transcriptional regulator [Bacillus paralicheniformis]PRS16524.1 hypothetical protein C6W27_08980 [Bacillus paralicheniformis]